MLILKIKKIAIGSIAATKLKTMASKTDKLCLTTWVSFSQFSFGNQMFIISPETSVISKNKSAIANITKPDTKLFKTMPNMIEEIKIGGVITMIGTSSFAKNNWFTETGKVWINHIVFPSSERETLDIVVIAIQRLTSTGRTNCKSAFSRGSCKVASMFSMPIDAAAIDKTTINIGPIIVFTKYAGVEK